MADRHQLAFKAASSSCTEHLASTWLAEVCQVCIHLWGRLENGGSYSGQMRPRLQLRGCC